MHELKRGAIPRPETQTKRNLALLRTGQILLQDTIGSIVKDPLQSQMTMRLHQERSIPRHKSGKGCLWKACSRLCISKGKTDAAWYQLRCNPFLLLSELGQCEKCGLLKNTKQSGPGITTSWFWARRSNHWPTCLHQNKAIHKHNT